MVSTIKNWTSGLNNQFSSAIDQGVQYQEAVYGLKTTLLAAGWTVERSCDGATVSASDLWLSAANVIWGTEASQVHSWIVLAAPSGKGNPGPGEQFMLLINCDEDSADTTPQTVGFYLAHGDTYTGGSITTKPSVNVGLEDSVLSLNFIAWTSPIASRYSYWYTDDGDVFFAIKTDGAAYFRSIFRIGADPTNALGLYTMSLFAAHGGTNDVVTFAYLEAVASYRNFAADGTVTSSARVAGRSNISNLTLWLNGHESSSGRVKQGDIELLANSSASGCARDLGLLVDVKAIPNNSPFNITDSEDGDAIALLGIGDIMLPTIIAQAPIG